MEVMDFVALLPETTTGIQKLRHTLELFGTVRKEILSADPLTCAAREYQEILAAELEVDRFMVEDITQALLKPTPPVFPEYVECGFWTLGRRKPRFGTPWGGLTFDDINKNIDLIVRYGGSFEDEEDPPLWTICPITAVEGFSYKELSSYAAKCKNLDLWFKMNGDHILGKIVFR